MKRFAEFYDAEIEEKRQKSVPMATTKANLKAKRILELYVSEKKPGPDRFWFSHTIRARYCAVKILPRSKNSNRGSL